MFTSKQAQRIDEPTLDNISPAVESPQGPSVAREHLHQGRYAIRPCSPAAACRIAGSPYPAPLQSPVHGCTFGSIDEGGNNRVQRHRKTPKLQPSELWLLQTAPAAGILAESLLHVTVSQRNFPRSTLKMLPSLGYRRPPNINHTFLPHWEEYNTCFFLDSLVPLGPCTHLLTFSLRLISPVNCDIPTFNYTFFSTAQVESAECKDMLRVMLLIPLQNYTDRLPNCLCRTFNRNIKAF